MRPPCGPSLPASGVGAVVPDEYAPLPCYHRVGAYLVDLDFGARGWAFIRAWTVGGGRARKRGARFTSSQK